MVRGHSVHWTVGEDISFADYNTSVAEDGMIYTISDFEDGNEIVRIVTPQAYKAAQMNANQQHLDGRERKLYRIDMNTDGLLMTASVKAGDIAEAILMAVTQLKADHHHIVSIAEEGFVNRNSITDNVPPAFQK